LHSEPLGDRPEQLRAIAVAQWLYDNSLTEDEQAEFTQQTGWIMAGWIMAGWIMDSELADELGAPDFPGAPANGPDDIPI
jgi:hypothetical protein